MNLSQKLKTLRSKKNISQRKVAEEIGTTQQSYQRWEYGLFEPDIEMINRLANYFDVSVDFLVNDEVKEKVNPNEAVRINVLGRIPAGIPLEAIEDVVDWEEIPAEWLKKGEYFGLRIGGDSMAPKFLDGDTVIFKKQNDVESGQYAAVYVNGYDATFKRVVKKENGDIILQPLNPDYDPILVDNDETFTVVGIPVEIRRTFF